MLLLFLLLNMFLSEKREKIRFRSKESVFVREFVGSVTSGSGW